MSTFQRQRSDKRDLAELLRRLEAQEFDLVTVGRALLADPLWFAKVRDGRLHEICDVPSDATDHYR